jgi:two-component system nitrogen regulation response regulator GlnG
MSSSSGDYDARTAEVEIPRRWKGQVERRDRTRIRVPVLTVIFHPDPRRVGDRLWLSALMSGGEVEISRLFPRFAAPGQDAGQPLADPYISRTPFVLRPGDEGALILERGQSHTELHVDGDPTAEATFQPRDLERGVVLELARRVILLLHTLPPMGKDEPPRFGMVGESEAVLRLRQEIERVADLDVPVLLRGPTGTGKELAAQAIHEASRRRKRPLVSVNMAAIPPTLAASELFGAVRGAYTGSDRTRVGYFRKADGGTIFLDEVGESPQEVQGMLLRVLESGEIQSVGAAEHDRVDVRVLAATDQDLEGAIDEGRFRAPLLHRLAGFSIRVPPLDERRDDIGRLLFHFLREELSILGEEQRLFLIRDRAAPWLPASIVSRLVRYDWPGNIRELRNVARQLVIGSRGSDTVQVNPEVEAVLRAAEARTAARQRERPTETDPSPTPTSSRDRSRASQPDPYRAPSDVSEDELQEVLRRHRWTVKPAATELGISRASLYNLMERSPKIRKASDLTLEEIQDSRQRTGGSLDAMVDDLEVSRRGLEMRMKELELR